MFSPGAYLVLTSVASEVQRDWLQLPLRHVVAYCGSRWCADPRAWATSFWIKVADGAGKDTLVSKPYGHTQTDTHLLTTICLFSDRNSAFGCNSSFYWYWFYQGHYIDFVSKSSLRLTFCICDAWKNWAKILSTSTYIAWKIDFFNDIIFLYTLNSLPGKYLVFCTGMCVYVYIKYIQSIAIFS